MKALLVLLLELSDPGVVNQLEIAMENIQPSLLQGYDSKLVDMIGSCPTLEEYMFGKTTPKHPEIITNSVCSLHT